jgi:hypothetical protein
VLDPQLLAELEEQEHLLLSLEHQQLILVEEVVLVQHQDLEVLVEEVLVLMAAMELLEPPILVVVEEEFPTDQLQ